MKPISKPETRNSQRGRGVNAESTPVGPGRMMLRWFLSRTVRQAVAMRKHVRRILSAQRDILSPQAMQAVSGALDELRTAARSTAGKAALLKQMDTVEAAANKWLKPYPHASWRENVEVLLVALAVAMGIRTFFVQPFKIPTGSMQPTLFGVTSENLMGRPDFKIPTGLARLEEWFQGISYIDIKARTDGALEQVSPPLGLPIFYFRQTLRIGGRVHTIWFPPDYGAPPNGTLQARAELRGGEVFQKGDPVVRLKAQSGDHLFVDRLTYNFRKPQRGEIVVFETSGIDRLAKDQQNTFYIKRLVGLGGEHLMLKQDYTVTNVPRIGDVPTGHLVVDGRELSGSTPHFENVYSFSNPPRRAESLPYMENHYYGHALIGELALNREYAVPPRHLFVMGDNTMNSSDSRFWGDFPSDHVIGKSFFVYWPITSRFGWGNR